MIAAFRLGTEDRDGAEGLVEAQQAAPVVRQADAGFAGLALAGLGEAGSKAAVLPGLAQRMEALIGEGAGGRDLGALARHLFADESGDAGESSPDS